MQKPYRFDEALLVFSEMADQLSYDMVQKNVVSDHLSFWVGFDHRSLDSGIYDGAIHIDHYGRAVPKHVGGSVRLPARTNSTDTIIRSLRDAFVKKVDRHLLIRRLGVSADGIRTENPWQQLDLFSDTAAHEKEQRIQKAMLEIRRRFGANAVLRGSDYLEGATTRERNGQIGGHRA